ncbi:hypothetical protein G4888_06320 [Blautia wexlerae]|uniref:glycine rich domain-containing protein n=1 Tax=Blautia wexlerae TaxID=418240 RepID=UPI00156FEC69|nr:glycine rich domain-containing protein [Blautia wexlerae]NSF63368.1 hypothetical protein [Blautia wexlerae]
MSKNVEYVSFTGNQFIDTGVRVTGNSTIELTYTYTSSTTGAVFGSRTNTSGTDSVSFSMFVVNGDVRSDHFGTSKTLDKNTYNPKEKHTYKITPDAIYCDGKQVYTQGVSSNTTPSTLYIGAVKTNGSVEKYSTVNLYSFKIYHGNTLVRDFVPHKDDNEKFCLKDAIENKFYYSNNALQGPVDLSHIKTGDILNFDYTGAVQAIALPKGIYKLECWGAQGGYSSSNSGIEVGMGGKGGYSVGTITLNQKTPIYIYAGGVGSISGNGKADGGFPNGGSSWASNTSEGAGGGGGSSDIRIGTDSLHARVIVAGGGGGGGEDNETGGYGGGETGGTSGSGTPGSQTAPSGYFGIGGHTSYDGGGGGGGWYGACPAGGQTTPATSNSGDDTSGSPGGSGYVYTSSTAKNYPNGCLVNSTHYLTNAKTIAGNTSFPSPSGTSETGHSGNGYCRITVIECNSTALYAKVNNSLKKATSIYFKMNNKIYGIGADNSSNTNMNFSYTGSVQTATLDPGKYILECWGAQGGSYSSYSGGAGGYSIGTITLSQRTNLYIYVGGQPATQTSTGATSGGFNGGGAGCSRTYNYSTYGQGGGGASDIRIGQDSFYARVIVAGGGGGSSSEDSFTTKYGGGISGGSSVSGYGATQTSAGTNGLFGQGGAATTSGTNYNYGSGGGGGGFYGGGACSSYSDSTNYRTYNGGGSGYVYTSNTASNYPSGCLLNSSYYLTNAQTISGNQNFQSPTGDTETGHVGNGYVKITKLTDTIYLSSNSDVIDFDYTGAVQSVTLNAGTYTLECWGAQGGYRSSSSYGGAGGYSIGTLSLSSKTTLYIYVGGSGNSVTSANSSGYYPGGFNGGGYRNTYKGGGGATDIRIGTDSLYSRVIVAGGGGSDGSSSQSGGYAGGTSGARGSFGYGSYGYGGNQTATYSSLNAIASQGTNNNSSDCAAGFGFGGFGCYSSSGYGGAGGGGWYGGQGTYPDGSGDDDGGGGGGSGYVYTSSTAKNYPQGCLLNSSYYLTDAQTIAGNQAFTSPEGTSETGHSGNGFCRITNMTPKQYGMFIKRNGAWTHIDL